LKKYWGLVGGKREKRRSLHTMGREENKGRSSLWGKASIWDQPLLGKLHTPKNEGEMGKGRSNLFYCRGRPKRNEVSLQVVTAKKKRASFYS